MEFKITTFIILIAINTSYQHGYGSYSSSSSSASAFSSASSYSNSGSYSSGGSNIDGLNKITNGIKGVLDQVGSTSNSFANAGAHSGTYGTHIDANLDLGSPGYGSLTADIPSNVQAIGTGPRNDGYSIGVSNKLSRPGSYLHTNANAFAGAESQIPGGIIDGGSESNFGDVSSSESKPAKFAGIHVGCSTVGCKQTSSAEIAGTIHVAKESAPGTQIGGLLGAGCKLSQCGLPIKPGTESVLPVSGSYASAGAGASSYANKYTGPFPGPIGSIYDSKPVVGNTPGTGHVQSANIEKLHENLGSSQDSKPSATHSQNLDTPEILQSEHTYPQPNQHGSAMNHKFPGNSGSIYDSKLVPINLNKYNPQTTAPGSAFNTYTFPGQPGSIHDSKPAQHSSTKPTVNYESQTEIGFHYVGPFPGPSGSIYDSKPAISTNYNKYNGGPGGHLGPAYGKPIKPCNSPAECNKQTHVPQVLGTSTARPIHIQEQDSETPSNYNQGCSLAGGCQPKPEEVSGVKPICNKPDGCYNIPSNNKPGVSYPYKEQGGTIPLNQGGGIVPLNHAASQNPTGDQKNSGCLQSNGCHSSIPGSTYNPNKQLIVGPIPSTSTNGCSIPGECGRITSPSPHIKAPKTPCNNQNCNFATTAANVDCSTPDCKKPHTSYGPAPSGIPPGFPTYPAISSGMLPVSCSGDCSLGRPTHNSNINSDSNSGVNSAIGCFSKDCQLSGKLGTAIIEQPKDKIPVSYGHGDLVFIDKNIPSNTGFDSSRRNQGTSGSYELPTGVGMFGSSVNGAASAIAGATANAGVGSFSGSLGSPADSTYGGSGSKVNSFDLHTFGPHSSANDGITSVGASAGAIANAGAGSFSGSLGRPVSSSYNGNDGSGNSFDSHSAVVNSGLGSFGGSLGGPVSYDRNSEIGNNFGSHSGSQSDGSEYTKGGNGGAISSSSGSFSGADVGSGIQVGSLARASVSASASAHASSSFY